MFSKENNFGVLTAYRYGTLCTKFLFYIFYTVDTNHKEYQSSSGRIVPFRGTDWFDYRLVQFGFLLSKISSDQCHEAFSTRDTIDLPNNQNNSTRKVQSLSSRESDQCGRPNTSMSAPLSGLWKEGSRPRKANE
jgi:hypothetical protein